jgi:hypothetical protein
MPAAVPPDSDAPPTSRARERLRLLVLWGATIALVAYLATTTDLETFGRTLLSVSPFLILGLTLVEVLCAWLYDSLTLTILLRRFHAPVRYGEVVAIKGASLLLNVVNYNAGVLAIAYFLRDRRRVPFLETLGSMLLLNGVDLFVMALSMGLGWIVVGDALDPVLLPLVATIVPLMVGGFLANGLFWKVEPRLRLLHGLTRRSLFASLRRATFADYVVLSALRLGLVVIYWTYQYIILQVFGIDVPVSSLLVIYPMMVFVGTLPISVSGFGSSQLAARFFFAAFVLAGASHAEAVVDACTTASLTGFLIWRVVVGVICLPLARGSSTVRDSA